MAAVDLYEMSFAQLENLLAGWGYPVFHARQVWRWLYRQLVTNVAVMSDLPLELRTRLADSVVMHPLETLAVRQSDDGQTEKRLFLLQDGETVETVRMSYHRGHTLCLSSQVGCAMGCVFCATGQMGFRRHLTAGEMVQQVTYFQKRLRDQNARLTNLVFMGMGEPLHNYGATLQAVRRLVDRNGFNLSARRITISTIGIPYAIRALARERLPLNLAVSLHAATDDQRKRLVPAARRWPLAELMDAVAEFASITGRRVTMEWALIKGENDSASHASALAELLDGLLCHVNLIPLNPTGGYVGRPPDRHQVQVYRDILTRHGVPSTIRVGRGQDIQAGCGQLRAHADDACSGGQ